MRADALMLFVLAVLGLAPAPRPQAPAPLFRPAVQAGDLIYASGVLPTDERRQIVGGDIRAQTARALDTLRAVLRDAGSDLSLAASVHVYLKRASDFQAMNEVYATYWPNDPPARTTVVTDLVVPEALVEISAVAVRRGADRVVVHPPAWPKSPSPYSYAIKSGDTLFLSGLVPRRPEDNTPVKGDIAVQTRAVMDSARAILAAGGMRLADVVSSRVYITDTANFQAMNAAYREAFPKNPPARATVRSALSGPDYLVEVALVAVAAPDRKVITAPAADGRPAQPNPNLSSAILAGNRLFVSGMLGATDATRGDTRAQTAETLVRIERTLAAAGFTSREVVDSVVYLTDVGQFSAMNEAYRRAFPDAPPARTTVGTGLMSPDGLVEIMVVAVKPR